MKPIVTPIVLHSFSDNLDCARFCSDLRRILPGAEEGKSLIISDKRSGKKGERKVTVAKYAVGYVRVNKTLNYVYSSTRGFLKREFGLSLCPGQVFYVKAE